MKKLDKAIIFLLSIAILTIVIITFIITDLISSPIKINDNILDEIFYDETNMKIIDEDEMQNYFDYSNFLEELKWNEE